MKVTEMLEPSAKVRVKSVPLTSASMDALRLLAELDLIVGELQSRTVAAVVAAT